MNALDILRLVMVVSLFAATASTSVAEQTDESAVPVDVEQAVKACLVEMQQAAQELDVDKLFGYVIDHNRGVIVQDGRVFRSHESARESIQRAFQNLTAVSYEFDSQELSLLAPHVVLAVETGQVSVTLMDGRQFRRPFAQTVVLKLTDGQWKVYHAHRSQPTENQ